MTLNELIEKLVALQPEHGDKRVLSYVNTGEDVGDVYVVQVVDLDVRDKYDVATEAPYSRGGYDWCRGKTVIIGAE